MPLKSYKPSAHAEKAILGAVRQTPGIRADALATEVAMSRSTVSGAGRSLVRDGRLIRQRIGRFYHYYLPSSQPTQVSFTQINATDIEVNALRSEVNDLRREVEELRAFKERAVLTYPDLDVDNFVLQARKIAANILPEECKTDCLLGLCDKTPEVRIAEATLRALAEQQEG